MLIKNVFVCLCKRFYFVARFVIVVDRVLTFFNKVLWVKSSADSWIGDSNWMKPNNRLVWVKREKKGNF